MSKIYNYKFRVKDPNDVYHVSNPELLGQRSLVQGPPVQSPTVQRPTVQSPVADMLTPIPVLNQGQLGSCLENAMYATFSIATNPQIKPSRLFIYICGRAEDKDSLCQDTGTSVAGGMNAVRDYGLPAETAWPYIISNYSKLPPSIAFKTQYNIQNFMSTYIASDNNLITNLQNVIGVLKKPIVIGVTVYSSFEGSAAAATGIIPMPVYTGKHPETLLGGHAITLVGYNTTTQYFMFQNSWGTSWGQGGYGFLPYAYIQDPHLANDFCYMSFTFNGKSY